MKNSIKTCILFGTLALTAASCGPDWGQMDPPAGNQIYPSLQNVGCYNFDEEFDLSLVELAAIDGGPSAVIAVDDSVQSPVINISKGSYARLVNALKTVDCQTSASVSFWYKQLSGTTPAEGETAPLDAVSPILHWETEGSSLDFTANGGLLLKSGEKNLLLNDWATGINDFLKADKWQFVTLVVSRKGYRMFVGGEEMPISVPEDTDLTEAVTLMNRADYVTLNADQEQDMLIDDFTFFRNSATEKEARQPKKGKIGQTGGNDGPDYSTWMLVGEEDNSTGFWTAWGPYVNLTGDGTIHYEFLNYSDEGGNWRNWLLCLTNGVERGGDGYLEYMVMRSDAWGWGAIWETGEISHEFNWDTFCHDMNGAFVSMDINRKGTGVEVVCNITKADGEALAPYRKTIEGVDVDTMGSFLLVEGGHLLIDPESVFTGNVYKPGEYTVGTDLNTGFWSAWSKQVRMEGSFKNFAFEFINHSPGAGSNNWQNWGLIVTNGYQSGGDQDPAYHEHYYLRADAYGWGDLYGASTMTHGFDWGSYTEEMKDAYVKMLFSYENQELTMSARQTKADGDRMPEYRFVTPGMPAPISLILTCEGSWLEILKAGYYPFADMSAEEND